MAATVRGWLRALRPTEPERLGTRSTLCGYRSATTEAEARGGRRTEKGDRGVSCSPAAALPSPFDGRLGDGRERAICRKVKAKSCCCYVREVKLED